MPKVEEKKVYKQYIVNENDSSQQREPMEIRESRDCWITNNNDRHIREDYQVKLVVTINGERKLSAIPVRFGITSNGDYAAQTLKAAKELIEMIPETMKIVSIESRCNSETKLGDWIMEESGNWGKDDFVYKISRSLGLNVRAIYMVIESK